MAWYLVKHRNNFTFAFKVTGINIRMEKIG